MLCALWSVAPPWWVYVGVVRWRMGPRRRRMMVVVVMKKRMMMVGNDEEEVEEDAE